jgi:ribonuclease P protein component
LRLSVDRNRVKRIIREEFRQHAVRQSPLDLLITLRSAVPAQPSGSSIDKQQGKRLRLVVSSLLDSISRRMSKGI